MNTLQLFEGLATSDSLFILIALGLAYLFGGISMLGYMFVSRQRIRQTKIDNQNLQKQLSESKEQYQELLASMPPTDLLKEFKEEGKSKINVLQKEFNDFRSEFQDSIEFYVHSIEELTESNHKMTLKLKALERENEQLVKAVWSDDLSFRSFNEDKGKVKTQDRGSAVSDHATPKSFETDEATRNIQNWIASLRKKNITQDNLTKIKGISKELEKRINALGIISYTQLSLLDDALIEDVAKAINYYSRRIKREDWVGQAYLFAKEKS